MANNSSRYYVGIMSGVRVQYITRVVNSSREAWWEDGKPAMAMSKTHAEDVYNGLRCNGYKAVMIKMPGYELPENPKEVKANA